MTAWLRDLLDALLLRRANLARIADRPDAMFRGFTVVVAVALFAGLPVLISDVVRGFQPPAVVEPSDLQPGAGAALDMLRPWLQNAGMSQALTDQVLQMAASNTALMGSVAAQIDRLPTTLPRPLARTFIGLGRWLSRPFADSPLPLAAAALGAWLGYGVWVMLAAKLLGGRATLHGFFGATAFFAVPHVLTIFAGVPVAGGILGAIAFLWGLVIYVVAAGASHRLSAGRAIVAVFAPVVLFLTLVAVVLLVMAVWGLAAGLSGMR